MILLIITNHYLPIGMLFMQHWGIFGSGVIASVYTNLLKEDKRLKFAVLSLLVMGWFVTASIPVLLIYPRVIFGFGLVIALFVQIPARLTRNSSKEGRRFELPTLKKLLPVWMEMEF